MGDINIKDVKIGTILSIDGTHKYRVTKIYGEIVDVLAMSNNSICRRNHIKSFDKIESINWRQRIENGNI